MLSSLCHLFFFLQQDCAQESSIGSSTKLSKSFGKCIFLNWSKHCRNRLLKELSKTFFFFKHRSCLGCEAEHQLSNRPSSQHLLLLYQTQLVHFFILGEDFPAYSTPCHFHGDAAFPKYLLAANQSSSMELCAVENAIHCFHEKNPTLYLHLYLPFLFAILLKAAVTIFLPWIHPKSSNSLLLKCVTSMVSASIAVKLLPCTFIFSGDWRHILDIIMGRGK